MRRAVIIANAIGAVSAVGLERAIANEVAQGRMTEEDVIGGDRRSAKIVNCALEPNIAMPGESRQMRRARERSKRRAR